MREVIILSYKDLSRKINFVEVRFKFNFNNFRVVLGIRLKLCTSAEKGLQLKLRKFYGLIGTFLEVTGENW